MTPLSPRASGTKKIFPRVSLLVSQQDGGRRRIDFPQLSSTPSLTLTCDFVELLTIEFELPCHHQKRSDGASWVRARRSTSPSQSNGPSAATGWIAQTFV